MKPLDKKQIPQVIVLAVLAVAFFAYFAAKMIMPTPAAAGTQPPAPAAVGKPQPKTVALAAPDAAPGTLTAPAPVAGMHDPFVQGVSDQVTPLAPSVPAAAPKPAPAVRTASLKSAGIAPLAIPSVPALPTVGIREEQSPLTRLPSGVSPLPAVPVTPDWSVTGVLQSGAEHVAILRSGEARRFVKQGDYVDSQFVVAAVTRDCVILRHGHSRFVLPLGGAKTGPVGPAKTTAPLGGIPEAVPSAPPAVTAPGVFPDLNEGRPAVHTSPRSKPAVPGIARLPKLPIIPRAFSAARPILARFPDMARHRSTGATVRVADYQDEQDMSRMPAEGSHGLLPSGMAAPDFSLSTLGGETFTLSQFRASVVVLDFWASWYAPSARSLSALALLQKTLGAQGLTVLAINSWDNKTAMQAALEGGEGSTMQMFDPGVSNESVAVRLYHAPDVPTFYVIDREGRIAGAFVGSGTSTIRNIQVTLAKLGLSS